MVRHRDSELRNKQDSSCGSFSFASSTLRGRKNDVTKGENHGSQIHSRVIIRTKKVKKFYYACFIFKNKHARMR